MKKVIDPAGKEIQIPEGAPLPPGFKEAPTAKKEPDKKDGDKKEADKKDGPIKRTSEPPAPPDRRELSVRPDEQGMVQFQFRNQAWPDLLKWVADISGMSLDWQELPNDYLNLATQGKQSVEEARDLFNRHLLARGYTMLEFDGVLQVVKTENINPALVPKVNSQELERLKPNRFVRTTFTLNTLIAEDVVEEFKALMSTNGKLTALTNTNRLEAMDAAINLREVHRIIRDEQSEETLEGKAREFKLNHVRAEAVKTQLESFLGIEKPSATVGRMTPEQLQMMQQQQQQLMQQQQQQGAKAKLPSKDAPKIYLVANTRQNSVVVSAPPNKMAIIAAFIRRVDVPSESSDLASLQARMRVYRLTSLDPEQLVRSLQQMDALEPMTKLEVDKEAKSIIAYASLADHLVISQMIQRLDGSAREAYVITLRRLQANEVAGTIKFLMGNDKKEDDSNSRRSYYYYYDPFFNNNNKKKDSTDQFRVAANVQDNQLLIWANESEKKEVDKLLVKLGELPPEGGRQQPFRVIEAHRSPETWEYLKRLQEAWSQISPTPLVLPDQKHFDSESKSTKSDAGDSQDPKKQEDKPQERAPSTSPVGKPDITSLNEAPKGRLSSARAPTEDEPPPANAVANNDAPSSPDNGLPKATASKTTRAAAPIQISLDAEGNLVLYSQDLEALIRLEELMLKMAPPEREYDVYVLKHQRPSWIKLQLEDYFKDETKGNDDRDAVFRWIFDMAAPEKKTDPDLGKKRKLRFVDDPDTKSLIVIGANQRTRATIERLIKLWDVPEPRDVSRDLYTKVVKVEFSQADSIVEAVKDAYRDFLSANDKAFQSKDNDKEKGEGGKKFSSGFSISDGSSSSSSGKLSLGIDRVTNSIIVVAEKTLLDLVCKMITDLDERAKPTGAVQVLQLDGGVNSPSLEKALRAMMQSSKPPNGKEAQQQQQNDDQAQANERAMNSNSNNGSSRSSRRR
jgi:type II secretory pathway component GspD/PulD (secretin)